MAASGGGTEPVKVVMLGNTGVGKSNLVGRFYSNDFSDEFISTIGVEFVTKTIDVDGQTVKLQVRAGLGDPQEGWRRGGGGCLRVGMFSLYSVCAFLASPAHLPPARRFGIQLGRSGLLP